MTELTFEYFRSVAKELVLVSVFLGGISATILGTLIIHKNDSRVFKFIILGLSFAAVSFIVAVIGLGKVQMILTPDSPYENKTEILMFPRIVGGLAFYLGIYSLLTVISLSGWMQSKRIGYFTAAMGIISGVLVFFLT